jgi:hypothetical protein
MMSDFGNGDFNPGEPEASSRALEILEHGAIDEEYGILRWSSNYAFLVSVQWQGEALTAVYKPQNGERPLWDFPDGTLCYRELASFVTSEQLGWSIVPPTVLREGSRGLGTFQFFVDHDPEVNYFTFSDEQKEQLRQFVIFDYVVNNADRKGGHCLLDAFGHIWGIDHGITFHASNKLRTVIWDFAGQPVEASIMADIEKLCAALDDESGEYRQRLASLLARSEITAFQARVRALLRRRRYPVPGAGPNYPWPPV